MIRFSKFTLNINLYDEIVGFLFKLVGDKLCSLFITKPKHQSVFDVGED